MRRLTATLNELLSRLEREAGLRGRFYAAASHELRTPIQVLLGQIDVTLSRPRSVAEHEKVLLEVQTQTIRLANLVQDLLQLNALEMRQSTPPVENTNLAYWVERGLETQHAELERRGLKVEAQIEDTPVAVPTSHLEILMRNLWENAIKYAAGGSTVTVRTFLNEGGAEVRLWNRCSLSEETDPSAWFEPFYRPDNSRNSQTGGNGLGLAISAAVARANGWQLRLVKENQGVLAIVVIPKETGID
jgi:signal transduction histidine kinase